MYFTRIVSCMYMEGPWWISFNSVVWAGTCRLKFASNNKEAISYFYVHNQNLLTKRETWYCYVRMVSVLVFFLLFYLIFIFSDWTPKLFGFFYLYEWFLINHPLTCLIEALINWYDHRLRPLNDGSMVNWVVMMKLISRCKYALLCFALSMSWPNSTGGPNMNSNKGFLGARIYIPGYACWGVPFQVYSATTALDLHGAAPLSVPRFAG